MPDSVRRVQGEFNDVLIVSELRGDYPDVSFFADVDIAELTKGDPDPMYLTIPIGKANVISGNKRYYDEKWLQELERQVVANRPIGILGHLSEEELATKFPEEAIHWLGVRRVGETLWAKGYVPAGAARERIRRYKATNKTIGTSIFALAEGVWDKARGAMHMLAETLKLQQIDIGPADRIGIPALASVPILTAEMQDEIREEEEQEDMPEKGKLDYINEMTADDARLLPDSVRQAIVESVPTPPEVGQVQELRQALGVDENADLGKLVSEMLQAQAQQSQDAIKARIVELASDEEKGIKIPPVRAVVIDMVEALEPKTVEEAEAKYNMIVTSGPITELLKDRVVQAMGPRQGAPLPGQNNQTGKYFRIPQEA